MKDKDLLWEKKVSIKSRRKVVFTFRTLVLYKINKAFCIDSTEDPLQSLATDTLANFCIVLGLHIK